MTAKFMSLGAVSVNFSFFEVAMTDKCSVLKVGIVV